MVLIFLTATINVFAQNTEMINYINQYRVANGKKTLLISKKLTEIAENQNSINIKQDSINHSHIVSEVATMGHSLPTTNIEKDKFVRFLKNNFNITYLEPKTNEDVVKYVKLYIIFLFDSSTKHKSILLGNYKSIGVSIDIKDIEHKTNTIKIGSKTFVFENMISHYKVNFYTTIDFN